MTEAEKKLWFALRDRRMRGIKFVRQVPVANYVVDFLCRSAKLVLEVDGGQHDANGSADEYRTRRLNELGYRVLRFWNNDVLSNLEGTLLTILQELGVDPAAPSPRESGERAGGEGSTQREEKPC